MRPGTMDRRVQFQRAPLIGDGVREKFGEYAPHGLPIWAAKKPVSDGERAARGTTVEDITTRFVVRYSSHTAGIKQSDRLTCEGVPYDIVGIKELGRREGFEITCRALPDG